MGKLRTWFGPTWDEDLKQTEKCVRLEYPTMRAKREHKKTPSERLSKIVYEECVKKRLAGATF
jgi:hypothetical protein